MKIRVDQEFVAAMLTATGGDLGELEVRFAATEYCHTFRYLCSTDLRKPGHGTAIVSDDGPSIEILPAEQADHFHLVASINGTEVFRTPSPILYAFIPLHALHLGFSLEGIHILHFPWTEADGIGFVETRKPRGERPPLNYPTVGGIYFIQAGSDGPIKIGFTTNLARRLLGIQTSSPFRLTLLGFLPDKTVRDEQELHAQFASLRTHGEWFTAGQALLDFINTEAKAW